MKRGSVLFKAHSPYTLLLSAIMAGGHFEDKKTILIMPGANNSSFKERVLGSGLFDEVLEFDERVREIHSVEEQVDLFLREHNDIERYFMCVFSDRFSYLLALRLSDSAIVSVFPEGSSSIQLTKKISLVFRHLYNKEEHIRVFYKKYPIDMTVFKESWMFDTNIEQGGVTAKKVWLDLSTIVSEHREVLEKTNQLFGYRSEEIDCDILFLDSNVSNWNMVFEKAEYMILRHFFLLNCDKKILVKLHPGQDKTRARWLYDYSNTEIYKNDDTPWELILLNSLSKDCICFKMIACLTMSTAIYSTINIMRDHPISIVSLEGLIKPCATDYFNEALAADKDYNKSLYEASKKVTIWYPNDGGELERVIHTVWNTANTTSYHETYDANIPELELFYKAGNMHEKSVLIDSQSDDLIETYYLFFGEDVKMVFTFPDGIDGNNFLWWPSESSLFSRIRIKEVLLDGKTASNSDALYINDDPIKSGWINLAGAEPVRVAITDNNDPIRQMMIVINTEMRKSYIECYRALYEDEYRRSFYEFWVEQDRESILDAYLSSLGGKTICVFGDGPIGRIMYSELLGLYSNVRMAVTNKDGKPDHIMDIKSLSEIKEEIACIIITPVWDHIGIIRATPYELKGKAVTLTRWIDDVKKIGRRRRG